jgi:hypothetical protein
MTFTKNKGLFLVIVAIVLGFFNAIAFVLPFARLGGFWTGYAFATLAILLTAFVLLYAFGHEGMKSKFYGVPLTFIVWPYLIVQVILSIVEMAMPGIPYKYEILLNCVPLAIVLIGLIGVNAGKEEIERLDAKVKGKVFYIKSLQGDVESFASRAQDAGLQKCLKALAETIRYSDPMSAPQLATVENAIEAKVASLGEAVGANADAAKSLCDELQQLFADRNRKCKLLK